MFPTAPVTTILRVIDLGSASFYEDILELEPRGEKADGNSAVLRYRVVTVVHSVDTPI